MAETPPRLEEAAAAEAETSAAEELVRYADGQTAREIATEGDTVAWGEDKWTSTEARDNRAIVVMQEPSIPGGEGGTTHHRATVYYVANGKVFNWTETKATGKPVSIDIGRFSDGKLPDVTIGEGWSIPGAKGVARRVVTRYKVDPTDTLGARSAGEDPFTGLETGLGLGSAPKSDAAFGAHGRRAARSADGGGIETATTPEPETLPLGPEAEAALARAEAALGLGGTPEPETAPEPRTPETPAETIARLEAENTRLHERVTELETRIDRLTTEITSLRTRIDELLATRPPEPEPAPSPVPEPRPRPPRPEAGGGDDTEFGPDRVPDHLVKYYELTRAEALANVGKGIAILAEYMPVADLRKQATRGAFVAAYERAEAMFRDHGEYSKYLATLGTHPEATDPRGDDDDEEESGDLAAALERRRLVRAAEGDDDDPIGVLDSDDLAGDLLRRRAERDGEAEPDEGERRTFRSRIGGRLANLALRASLARGPAVSPEPPRLGRTPRREITLDDDLERRRREREADLA